MNQSDDVMVVIKVENDPVDGIVWQWRADGQYFRFDDKLTKEINHKLRDYFLRLMAEEGLLMERKSRNQPEPAANGLSHQLAPDKAPKSF